MCKNCDPVINKGLCHFDVLQKSQGLTEDSEDKRQSASELKVISLQKGLYKTLIRPVLAYGSQNTTMSYIHCIKKMI
jgi:hypothetical protein